MSCWLFMKSIINFYGIRWAASVIFRKRVSPISGAVVPPAGTIILEIACRDRFAEPPSFHWLETAFHSGLPGGRSLDAIRLTDTNSAVGEELSFTMSMLPVAHSSGAISLA